MRAEYRDEPQLSIAIAIDTCVCFRIENHP